MPLRNPAPKRTSAFLWQSPLRVRRQQAVLIVLLLALVLAIMILW